MPGLRKWILYSTLFAVFSNRFFVIAGGLTLFYFYFIVLFNLALLVLQGYLWSPAKLRWFLAYLFASGGLGLLLGTGSVPGFLKSWFGIAICALYSAAFIRYMRFEAIALFRLYVNMAFYVACFGIVVLPVQPWPKDRLVGVFLEPSAFCIVCLPAIFYYADQWQRNRRYGARFLIFCLAFVLTFSSLGFLGLMMGGLLFGLRYRVGRFVMPGVVVLAYIFSSQQSDMFQMRMNDTFAGLANGDVSGINMSSLGVVANIFVTEHQFMEHPILGGGLGSHIVAHQRFIGQVPGTAFLPENILSLGQWDASSLFLRIVSELGLVGLAGAFWYLWRYFPHHGTPEERGIALGLLCYAFLKFLRAGDYFGSEQFFFLSIYTVIGLQARLRHAATVRQAGPAAPAPLLLPAEAH